MYRGSIWDGVTFGRARRRRRLRRQMRALDHWYEGRSSGRSHREGWRRLFVATATTALVTVGSLVFVKQQGLPVDVAGVLRGAGLVGSPDADSGGSYKFLAYQPEHPGVPVMYSPCKPIHVVVNATLAPPGGYDLVDTAVEQVADLTGLTLVLDGHSDQQPSRDRELRNGSDWAPVLIGWTTPEADDRLSGSVVGIGGSASITDPLSGYRYYVTGSIALDTPSMTRIARGLGGVQAARGVIMHELGHVLGLDHVADKDQLMSKSSGDGRVRDGDRRGFARVGQGRCYG